MPQFAPRPSGRLAPLSAARPRPGMPGCDRPPIRTIPPLAGLRPLLICALLAGSALLAAAGPAAASAGYYRFPDLHGDRLAFSAEGDLWTSNLDGTGVRRLTSHPGDEYLARFSPDGKWIAFAGDYDGNRDAFIIPADGGEPRRLTWHPGPDEPVAWSPDGAAVIIRSTREHPHWDWELYRVSANGGDPEKLPLGWAQNLAIDPQTGAYAFNRTGGGGTWKRYRGGTAADIWVGDPQAAEYRQVTNFAGNDFSPMWHGGKIWFLSDLGGTMNIWSMNPDGTGRSRHTDFGTWDARHAASDGAGRIVFTLAGDIHLFDVASGASRKLPIELPSERFLTRTRYPDPQQYITGLALSPDGDRVAIEARGEIFSIPAKDGVTLPITRGSGARENMMSYHPDGERLLYITDESGEQTIVTADAWGRGDVKTVVPAGASRVYTPLYSPDGAWIAWSDPSYTLWIAPASGGAPVRVDQSPQWEIREYAWSPDSRWLAYTRTTVTDRSGVWIYDTKEKQSRRVTDPTTDDRSPCWDPDGRYLYFVSDRVMNPMIGNVDFETIELSTSKPCALLLRPDVKNPVMKSEGAPPDGKEKGTGKDKKGKDGKGKSAGQDASKDGAGGDADKKPEPVKIDFDGIERRVVELPVQAGRYWGLAATSGKLFYYSQPPTGLSGREEDFQPVKGGTLHVFDLEELEPKTFMSEVVGYDLQPKSGKIAVQKDGGAIYVLDAGSMPPDDLEKKKVSYEGLVLEIDPREEWRQMYLEAWRNLRDFYWDANMGGVDWPAVRDQYASLLPRLATRADLHDLIAEMIGELSTSHTYVWGGDRGMPGASQVSTGLLGAQLERAGDAFRVTRIYRGAPADRLRSALDEPGAMVKEGEYIVAVNNRPVPADRPFESVLAGLAKKEVLLTVNGTPSKEGARSVVVKPMALGDAQALIYHDWVRRNREYVAEKTGGKIGYVHIPDMGGRGMREFDTWFYPQLDREGMVVDARWNGGGFVSQLMVGRFLRELLWWDRARGGNVSTYPHRVLNGPFVVLTNEFAGSDGDIFPAAIQMAQAAPVIGKRSWGGVIGIRGGRELVDKGAVTSPEFAWWHPQKGWGIENHGVDPDIVVENLPQELGRGIDAQLDRGISEVLRLHREKPPQKPGFGPVRDRSRQAFEVEITGR